MPRLLGQQLPARTLFWCGSAALLGLLLRLAYPLAAVMLGHERGLTASALVALSVLIAVLAGGANSRAVRSIRPVIFRALGSAARRQPLVAPLVSHAEVESEIARGAPWVEMHVAKTLPALASNLLALPLIAALSVAQLGVRRTFIGVGALLIASLVGALGIRWAVAQGKVAWRRYRSVSRLMERGVRGAGELAIHGLGERYELALLERVTDWTRLERRAVAASVVSAWSIPALAVGATVLIASLVSGLPLRALAPALLHAGRGAVVGGLLVLSAMPVLVGLARTLSQLGSQRASLELLEAFVAGAVAEPPAPRPGGAIGAVVLDDVSLRYSRSANEGEALEIQADLRWEPGVALALRGPTGAGKTSVLHLVAGLIAPTRGAVEVEQDGTSVGPEALVGRLVYIPQQAYFDDLDTLRESIRFMTPAASDAQALELLQQLKPSLTDLDRTVGSLSAGERRIVAIVRGLLRQPELLMIDEPELNLDRATCSALARVLRALKSRCRLLIATHDDELAAVADRVLTFDGHGVRMPGLSRQGSSVPAGAAAN